ncbi:MAG: glycosyltransferase family 2 protein [Hyphomicrobiales bacterium]|nr:glycosyltransferase family 2 protein [Hyphomicrobiales bacterium]MDE1971950.1 glycosyltransferase family 2 protein [Hyphomicrobiales bacterium]MDE2286118.1 glycosyltransferase family 2 protein [Hyphomicrobiales bacterium]
MSNSITPSVCLCVPTFRRPAGLRKLLAHIERSNYAGATTVIVVDNDAENRAGTAVVESVAPTFRFPIVCSVEPRRGHTYAYNTAFASACRAVPPPDYIAVLDDDEYPEPNWLVELMAAARAYEADIVGGPVFPVFDTPDHWLAESGLYAPERHPTGRVPMIYGAGNMLIRRTVLEQYLDEPFDHAFAFTGGSDSEFFRRCQADGRRFAWADDAHVFETTPPSRTTVGYLLRRKFRTGTEATRIDHQLSGGVRAVLRHWCKGLGLLGLGILSLPAAAWGGRRAVMNSLIWAARGVGYIAAEFGIFYEEYRNPR